MSIAFVGLGLTVFFRQPVNIAAFANLSIRERTDFGGLLLVLGALAFGASLLLVPSPRTAARSSGSRASKAILALCVIVGAAYVVGLAMFVLAGESPMLRLVWIFSIVGMAVAALASIGAYASGAFDSVTWREILFLVGITAIGYVLRHWDIAKLPLRQDEDTRNMAVEALRWLEASNQAIFKVGWAYKPIGFFLPGTLTMLAFGYDAYGFLMSTVLAGTAVIPVTYFLARELSNRKAAVFAALLMAIAHYQIMHSRVGITEATTLFVALSLTSLLVGLRTRQWGWMALGGLFGGLALDQYEASRILPFVTALGMVWSLVWAGRQRSKVMALWLVYGAGALVALGPLLAFAVKDIAAFSGRAQDVAITSVGIQQHLYFKYNLQSFGDLLLEQVRRSFGAFHFYSDQSPHAGFNSPMLDPFSGALFVLGLGAALSRLRSPSSFVSIAWITIAVVAGGTLSSDPPLSTHFMVVFPAVIAVAAFGAERLIHIASRITRRAAWLVIGVLLTLTLVAGVSNWNTFLQNSRDRTSPLAFAARYISNLPADREIWFIRDPFTKDYYFDFFNRGVPMRDVTAQQLRTAIPDLAKPVTFVVTPNHVDLLPLLSNLYPNAQADQPKVNGFTMFTAVTALPDNYAGAPANAYMSFGRGDLGGWLAGGVLLLILLAIGLMLMGLDRPSRRRIVEANSAGSPEPPLAERLHLRLRNHGVIGLSLETVRSIVAASRAGATSIRAHETSPLPSAVGDTGEGSPQEQLAGRIFARLRDRGAGALTGNVVTQIVTTSFSKVEAAAKQEMGIAPATRPTATPSLTTASAPSEPKRVRLSIRQRLALFNDWITLDSVPQAATMRQPLRTAGVVIAIALAFLGQALFEGQSLANILTRVFGRIPFEWTEANRLLAGSSIYVLAGVMFALAAPALRLLPDMPALRDAPAPKRPTYRIAQLIILTLSIAAALGAVVIYASQRETVGVRLMWVAGMLGFMAAWLPSLRDAPHINAERSPPFGAISIVVLVVIVAAGFWLRFDRVETVPSDLHGDMASYGLQARDILLDRQTDIFASGWAAIPIVGYLPSVLSMRIFGNDLFGLNMTAVIGGTLVLIALYLVVWRVSDQHRLAAIATAALAINIVNIHFSRLAAYMDPWPFNLFGIFFLVDGLRARRPISFAIAGLLLGLGLQMYYSGRVIGFIIATFLTYALLFRRRWITDNWVGLGVVILAVLIAIGPNLVFFYRNQDDFMSRSREVFLFNPPVMQHLLGMFRQDSVEGVVREQIKRALLMFHYSTDTSTQFGFQRPMFSFMFGPFVALGFAYAVRRINRPIHALVLVWWLLILVIGAILTGEAPFWPRLQGMPPAGAILAAIGLDRVWAVIATALNRLPMRLGSPVRSSAFLPLGAHNPRKPLAIMFVLLVMATAFFVVSGIDNWNLYFTTVRDNARGQAMMGRIVYELPPNIAACSFADPAQLSVRETAFLAYPRITIDLPSDAPDNAIARCPGPPFIWILSNNHRDRLPALRDRWPEGIQQEHRAGTGALIFTSYLVAPGVELGASNAYVDKDAVPPLDRGAQPAYKPDPRYLNMSAFRPDGTPFSPQRIFVGEATGIAYEIFVGKVTVTGGTLVVNIGPVPGYNAVFDYARLRSPNGTEIRLEAENAAATTGDQFSTSEGNDGHWWLQNYEPFSKKQGLVALKSEIVPMLTTSFGVPDGIYDLSIGSFTGDSASGPFALGVSIVMP